MGETSQRHRNAFNDRKGFFYIFYIGVQKFEMRQMLSDFGGVIVEKTVRCVEVTAAAAM